MAAMIDYQLTMNDLNEFIIGEIGEMTRKMAIKRQIATKVGFRGTI
jgi:hypothetical protein